ncbi:MAG TPA: hypothetical protein V6C97_19185 [Oculatellaceae cyanobacterium]
METLTHWLHTNWQHAALGVAVIAVIAFAIWQSARERRSSSAYLRHAIAVNLGILRNEHSELKRIASSHNGPAKTEALGLLESAQTTMTAIGTDLTRFSNRKLGKTLSQVFAAMNNTTKARRLLGACEPGGLE